MSRILNGLILVDKSRGPTSHDVVNIVRRQLQFRRVGHLGTLDPPATGLLVLCLGQATRLVEFMGHFDKEYEAVVRLGVVTDTQDTTGKTLREATPTAPTGAQLEEIRKRFTGEIEQLPPMYSAVKVGGRRLYEIAREGRTVERQMRKVTVHSIEIVGVTMPRMKLRVRCSKGTYIRALCADIGDLLGCGGALEALRRMSVGPFRVEDASAVEHVTLERIASILRPMDAGLANLPVALVRARSVGRVFTGAPLLAADLDGREGLSPTGLVRVMGPGGQLLAIGEMAKETNGALNGHTPIIHMRKVLAALSAPVAKAPVK